jgi:DNA (cytosine-5)-methyltransferase 1
MSLTYTDIFCGFGGSSIGLEAAGLELKLAANHWDRAIETHSANFPDADHLIADVNNYDMRRLPSTDVLWASPICTELSPAGGRKRTRGQMELEVFGHVPKAGLDRTRATFWDVIRATEIHRYKVVLVENVVEAMDWELIDVWIAGMTKLGYNVQIVSVSAAHIGGEGNDPAPQWRDRIYFVLTRTDLPIPDVSPRPYAWCPDCDQDVDAVQSWKKQHGRKVGKYRQQYVYRCPNRSCKHAIVEPYVLPAAAAIDWTDIGQRIGDRKKALAPATMRRIQAGIEQYSQPTMLAVNHEDGRYYLPGEQPLSTRSTKIGDGLACPPFLVDRRAYNDGDDRRVKPITEPVGTITANGRPHTLVTPPMIVPAGGTWNDAPISAGEPFRTRTTRETDGIFTPPTLVGELRRNSTAKLAGDAPIQTVTAGGNHHFMATPGAFIQKHHGGLDYKQIGHMTKPVSDPMPGVVARPNMSLVIPYRKGDRAHRAVDEPLTTVATREQHGVLAMNVDIDDCYFRMLKPREHGRAQRFHDGYTVYGNKSEQTMGFGNAVPANVAQWLGGIIAQLLGGAA